jgi:putative cell wall-binding protein
MPAAPLSRSHAGRWSALALAAAACLPLLVATAAPAGAGPQVQRIAGSDRYATAVAVSRSSHPAGAPVAVLTTGADFADALAGGPAASALGGPVLLVARDRAPDLVLDELRRLRPQRVLVLGGVSAVSDAVSRQLTAANLRPQRLAGSGRYETAAKASAAVFAPAVEVVYVATGTGYADALAGAAAAGAAGAPVLLVARTSLPTATAQELRRLAPRRIVILGGTAAVSAAVESELRRHAPLVSRLAGADRYATAATIARSLPRTPKQVFLATGQGFADALTGAPAAAAVGAPVLLVPPTCIPAPVEAELSRLQHPPMTLLGGVSVLSQAVAARESCPPPGYAPLASGVALTDLNDPRGPWKGTIVTVAPNAVGRLDTVLAQNALPGLETTSAMARRTGAVVAINGDYALPGGRPVHPFARNGRLLQTEQIHGRSVAVDARAARLQLGTPQLQAALAVPSGQRAPISRVNSGASGAGALALTTVEGGALAPVPDSSCAVRIRPRSGPTLAPDGRSVQPYEVRQVHCGAAALPPGDDILTTPMNGPYAPLLRGLRAGDVVHVSWSLGWRDVLDSIGGNPILVSKGAVVAGNVDGSTPYFARAPRTAVGYRPDGTVLLVTVDGRGAGGSAGMTLRELAELFLRLRATEAMGLDGGGSTTMVVNGRVRNVPSDGPERPVSSALVVLPQPTSAFHAASADAGPLPLTTREQIAAETLLATDPASTGGLRTGPRER